MVHPLVLLKAGVVVSHYEQQERMINVAFE